MFTKTIHLYNQASINQSMPEAFTRSNSRDQLTLQQYPIQNFFLPGESSEDVD